MSIVSKEKYDQMTEEERLEYCRDCWARGYGDCDRCAMPYVGKVPQ